MKKLLLIILLLVGCTREYTCDGHIDCPDDTGAGRIDGSQCDISIMVNWPNGEKEAEESCEDIIIGNRAQVYQVNDSLILITSDGDTIAWTPGTQFDSLMVCSGQMWSWSDEEYVDNLICSDGNAPPSPNINCTCEKVN